jgi:hypothetical protein
VAKRKLPDDFVKAPTFDNPLRATTGKLVVSDGKHELVLRIDEAQWKQLAAQSGEAGVSPEAFVMRLIGDWLEGRLVVPAPPAPEPVPAPEPAQRHGWLVNQLVGLVQGQLHRVGWLRRFLPVSALARVA